MFNAQAGSSRGGGTPSENAQAGPSSGEHSSSTGDRRLREPAGSIQMGSVYGAAISKLRKGPPTFPLIGTPPAVPTYIANLPHPFIPTNVHVRKNHHEDDQQYYEGFQLTHSPHDQPHVLASTYGNFPAKGAKQSASISGGVAKKTSKTQRNNARKRSNKNQNKDAAGPVPNVILTNPVFVAKEDVLKRPKGAPESLYPGKFDDLKKELCKRGINRPCSFNSARGRGRKSSTTSKIQVKNGDRRISQRRQASTRKNEK
jgi:hypothetical protein